jgi:hypothetical protein
MEQSSYLMAVRKGLEGEKEREREERERDRERERIDISFLQS